MPERFFDDSFEPNDNAVSILDVDELRQQHRTDFPRRHASFRHQKTYKILVIALAVTVVVSSVVAFASYLAIQRRSTIPGDTAGSPPDINDFFSSSPSVQTFTAPPSISIPTISPIPTAIGDTLSPFAATPNTGIPDNQETSPPEPTPTRTRVPTIPLMPFFTAPSVRNRPTSSPQVVSMRPTAGSASPPDVAMPTGRETSRSPNIPPQSQNGPPIPPQNLPDNPDCDDNGDCELPTALPSLRDVQPPVPTKPRTRAPTIPLMPIFIAPTPYKRATETPTEQPLPQIDPSPSTDSSNDSVCKDTGNCQIISNFPSLRDFLCFDEELGVAEDCPFSCGLCGGNVTIEGFKCVDDNSSFFFVSDYWGHQSCKWLSTKAEIRGELCEPGQEGYHHCPRLCGRCRACQDDFRAAIFISYTVGYKTCAWLSEQPTYQNRLCQPGEFGYKSCRETCGRCSVLEYGEPP